jgi:hypothetical protein
MIVYNTPTTAWIVTAPNGFGLREQIGHDHPTERAAAAALARLRRPQAGRIETVARTYRA